MPTFVINEACKDGKTISLSRVRKMADALTYDTLKQELDKLIDDKETVAGR